MDENPKNPAGRRIGPVVLFQVIAASFVVLNFLFASSIATGQQAEKEFTKGVVIENVISAGDPTKSYALYLPTGYTPTRKSPVLYCFDPLARGAVPVNRFKDAAEKYNYIVIGSNDSRNGPNPLEGIVRDLWTDSHSRFSIDDKRVYLAGFSGGARVAISVGFWLKDRVAGVVACGGGFPVNIPTSTPRSFVLFATTGTEDFNNPEMQSLVRTLETTAPPMRLTVFQGGHSWLPIELATDAIEWFEIQAIRSGLKEDNRATISALFDHALVQARAAEQSNDQYRAYLRYVVIGQDFGGLRDVADIQKKVTELKRTKEVRNGEKLEKEMEQQQNRRVQNIHTLIASSASGENTVDSRIELRTALADLRKTANSSEPSVNRTVAKRVIESLFIEFIELGNAAIAQKEYGNAIDSFLTCTEIQPENARIYFYLARAYSLVGDKKRALSSLRTAAENGFAGLKDVAGTEFAELQNDKRFQEILELVKKNAAK